MSMCKEVRPWILNKNPDRKEHTTFDQPNNSDEHNIIITLVPIHNGLEAVGEVIKCTLNT